MINLDTIRYFLHQKGFSFTITHYDPKISISSIRHFAAGESYHNALVIIPLLEQDSQPQDIMSTTSDCILLYMTEEEIAPLPSSSVPLIQVITKKGALLYNTLGEMLELFHHWEQQIQLFQLTGKDYQMLINACDQILASPLALVDKNYRYIAYSLQRSSDLGYVDELVENGQVPAALVTDQIITPGAESLEAKQDVFEFEDQNHFIGKNIHSHGQYVARLVMMHSDHPYENDYHAYILTRISHCISQKYEQEGTFYTAHEPTHALHLILQDALDGKSIPDTHWKQALAEKNWEPKDSYRIMLFSATYRSEKKLHAEYLCPQIETRWSFAVATEWKEQTIVLLNQRLLDKHFEQSLAYFVRDNLLTAGISRPFIELSNLPLSYIQAQKAMDTGLTEDPHLWYYFFDRYALSYLKKQCTQHLPPELVSHPALLQLKIHDAATGSQYYDSLRLFIETQFNMSAAADLAYVHRTTFIKRMERIQELTSIDLTNWDTRLYLMLSYSLL